MDSAQRPLTSPDLRKLLNALFKTEADFDAFCFDYYAPVKRRFAQGMDRVYKTTLLLESIDAQPLYDSLRSHDADALQRTADKLGISLPLVQ